MRIIPAYAGSTGSGTSPTGSPWDHPRIRGEHDFDLEAIVDDLGSSPHTRGAPFGVVSLRVAFRIIPAYAGSTRCFLRASQSIWDHPRIRGEHRRGVARIVRLRGSSPHTRGAHREGPVGAGRARIIPAYAGSTLGNPCNTKDRRRDYTSFPLPVTHPSGGGGS